MVGTRRRIDSPLPSAGSSAPGDIHGSGEDTISSRKADRPVLTAALDYLCPGDELAVWKLDRLGRSVKEVLTLADQLHERGIGLRILTGHLAGTYTPTGEGKFFFTIIAAFAEPP